GMNGRQLVDAGRRNRPDLKILFVTGYAYDKELGNSRLPQGAEVLPKPFTGVELAARARSLLRMTDTPSRLGAA
ncbi:MAG: hypothetical protein REJ23_06185, partial [Brevundimonas sp.]|nr:hypothetical protein [Brevundimonas sp.]